MPKVDGLHERGQRYLVADIEGKVKSVEDKVDKVTADLAAHKVQVAEAYATKAGLSEQTAQIMKAFDSLGTKIDRTNERLDNLMSARAKE